MKPCISRLLGTGKGNAITGKELAAMTGVQIRAITAMIEKERRAGIPICAEMTGKGQGYFLAANQQELKSYCNVLGSRVYNLAKTHSILEDLIDSLPTAI